MSILNHKYNTPVGLFNKILMDEERSLRLVLTGRCNLACEFCVYKVKDFYSPEINFRNFIEMFPTEKLKNTLVRMREDLGYDTVHLTGGEPTLSKNLIKIAELAKSNGFAVHICSNLISVKPLLELLNKGLLDELTFSYFPLDSISDRYSLPEYKGPNRKKISTILKNVQTLKSNFPNLTVKTNICISAYTDVHKLVKFIEWCWERGIVPRIQRDRSMNRISGSTDKTLILIKALDIKPEKVILRIPGNTEICEFKDISGRRLYVKLFNQNFRLEEICKICNLSDGCKKSLSTIRIYNTKNDSIICFCTVNNKSFSNLNIDILSKSKVLAEIYDYKKDKTKYFKKFCKYPNFQ